jgi:hypothetical protein
MVRPNLAGLRVTDIFDEIRDDLRAERAQHMLKRYGALIVVAAVLVVAGVAGWQVWRWKQGQDAAATATTFLDAMNKVAGPQAGTAGDTPAHDAAAAQFASVAATGPEGYRTLARLREAGLRATAGDNDAALKLWDEVGADSKAEPLLRDLAALLWAENQVDQGAPESIEGHLATLVVPGNPWRPMAQETQALLALRTGQAGRARDLLKQLTTDQMAPNGLRARAAALLSRLGDASPASTAATKVGG